MTEGSSDLQQESSSLGRAARKSLAIVRSPLRRWSAGRQTSRLLRHRQAEIRGAAGESLKAFHQAVWAHWDRGHIATLLPQEEADERTVE